MYEFNVDPALLLAVVAGLLALAFDWIPGVREWFDALTEIQKRLLNVGLVFGVAVVFFVGECYALFITNLTCDVKGAVDLLAMVFLAVGVNYGVHKQFKPAKK